MSYIGNPIVSTDFPVDYFSGNGSTTAFTLSVAPASVNSIDVQVSGVSQSPQTYSVSGTTLTFTAAPPTGSSNIVVRHLGIAGIPNTPSAASVTPAALSTPNAVYWDVNGNVGVGTTSPAGKFHVYAGGTYQNLIYKSESANTSVLRLAVDGDGPYIYQSAATSEFRLASQFPSSFLTFYTGTGGERMRIDSSGNVGIGTTSPSSFGKLAVVTTAGTNGLSVQQAESSNTTTSIRLGTYIGNLYGSTITSTSHWAGTLTSNLTFSTTDSAGTTAERMRIDANGRLLVGNSSFASYGQVTVQSTSSQDGIQVISNTTSGVSQLAFRNPNGYVGTITSSASSTAYNTSSDYRLKENISPMTGALYKVQQLKPVTYTWKVDGSEGQGFIAHELAEVVPDAVTGEKDAVDEDGNPKYQGIDVSFLVATLTAAIQEQQAMIEELKTDLANTKLLLTDVSNKVAALEAK